MKKTPKVKNKEQNKYTGNRDLEKSSRRKELQEQKLYSVFGEIITREDAYGMDRGSRKPIRALEN